LWWAELPEKPLVFSLDGQTAVDVTRGRIRVIAGLGSNATGKAVPRITPGVARVYAHLDAIPNATKLPIILRHVAPTYDFSDETLMRLSKIRTRDWTGGRNQQRRPMGAPAAVDAGRISVTVRR
jgi:hypothetical protein